MPNWVEGNLRIRGKKEDIIRFLMDKLSWPKLGNYEERLKPEFEEGTDEYRMYRPDDCGEWGYFEGTNRNFIAEGNYWLFFDEDPCTTCLDGFNAAWGIEPEPWVQFSKDYDLDFRLYGFDRGLEFGQDIVIKDGEITRNVEMKFEDYDWDCPFPNLGG